MSTFGEFRPVENGGGRKRTFMVAGSSLSVAESSVSSEWTTDSEGEVKLASNFDSADPAKAGTLGAKAKKKRVKKWRVKHSLAKHRHLCEASDSSRSSTSSSSTGDSSSTDTDSESAQEENLPKSEKRQSRNDRRMASAAEFLEVPQVPSHSPPGAIQWIRGSKQHRDLAFAPNFLSADDIEAVHQTVKHPSVREIHDRKGYLAFKHRVVRFEMQLRALHPGLYARLLELMRTADLQRWRRLRKKKNKVYPEVEYIEYDVEVENGECYIEPHVDNKAGVTLIAMLSSSSDYKGGNNCFRRGSGNEGHRQTQLQIGDVVMFRGEKLTHWITNVTSGRRVILQIELSRN